MIIVFGSNVVDLFFHLAEMPAADQAIHLDGHTEAPGGKGQNQAVAAAKAGAQVRFFGAVGNGGHGRQMLKNLQNHGINTSGIEILDHAPTAIATIFVNDDNGTHRVVVSQGANRFASQETVSDTLLGKDTTLLLQAELSLTETAELIRRAREKGCERVVVNLAPFHALPDTMLNNINYLVMNEHEATSLANHTGIAFEGFEDLASKFHAKYALTPIITLGENGVVAFHNNQLHKRPALSIKAVDTIGAGDAFCGFFSAAIDSGKSFEEALQEAIVAGSLACTEVGAQSAIPSADAVKTYLQSQQAA